MDGADHDQAQRRIENLNEERSLIRLNRCAFITSMRGLDLIEHVPRQRVAERSFAVHHQGLVAPLQPAQVSRRLLGGAGFEQPLQECAFHVRISLS
jgi:hypothetical protein